MAQAATLAMVDPKVAEFVTGSRRMLIDGAWVEAASGKTFPVYDPATEEVIAQVAEGGELVKREQPTRPSFGVPRTFGASRLPGSLSMAERPRGPQAQSLVLGMCPLLPQL